jgi:hypothetical protein
MRAAVYKANLKLASVTGDAMPTSTSFRPPAIIKRVYISHHVTPYSIVADPEVNYQACPAAAHTLANLVVYTRHNNQGDA